MLVLILVLSSSFCFNSLYSQQIPTSKRSEEVISRVKPILEKELMQSELKIGSPVYMRIFKESKEFEVWIWEDNHFELFKIYDICNYSGSLGPKLKEGDNQSPEGFYKVSPAKLNPNSDFHLSFDIGFPNKFDLENNRTGSYLMVHGNCVSIGCYAMTDSQIEEIYTLADQALRGGQPHFEVHIFPFRMTDKNMKRHKDSLWFSFWKNLKIGHDIFEKTKIPTIIKVKDKHYIFE